MKKTGLSVLLLATLASACGHKSKVDDTKATATPFLRWLWFWFRAREEQPEEKRALSGEPPLRGSPGHLHRSGSPCSMSVIRLTSD